MDHSTARNLSPSASARTSCSALGVIGDEVTGVTYVRFTQPFSYLADLGFTLTTLGPSLTLTRTSGGFEPDPRLFSGVDLIIFPQMVARPLLSDGTRFDLVTPICDRARDSGIKLIYSVDDHLAAIDAINPGYELISASIANLHTILARADALIVTTPSLRDSFSHLGKPTYLLPNAIEPARWRLRPRASHELRVGWAGGSSHLEDLLMVLPAIRKLQKRVACRFILQGITERTFEAEVKEIRRNRKSRTSSQQARAGVFLELVRELRTLSWAHVPFMSLHSYIETLPTLDLDIGICPLRDTPFSRHKSALKFYEYAAAGTMTIASDVEPYKDEVSILAGNDGDSWCDLLEKYIKDDDGRDRELRRQRDFVFAQRNIESLAGRWSDALHGILRG